MADLENIEKHPHAQQQSALRSRYPADIISNIEQKLRSSGRSPPSVAILLSIAVITRAACIGDPAVHMDEEFYLLVGDRIWHGALPYIDIWDRKPIGLFLIYALLRPLSANGIVAYQLGAFACAFLTALTVRRICLRFCNNICATLSGSLYLLFLPLLGGVGGQAPVFYNLLMAGAALLVLRRQEFSGERRRIDAYVAMALCGLALQIKYSVVFEGVVFGLWLLWREWQEDNSLTVVIRQGCIFVAIALIPSTIVAIFYAYIGHFREFFDANFLSISRVVLPGAAQRLQFLTGTICAVLPLLLMSLMAAIFLTRRPFKAKNLFLLSWAAAAIVGFFAIRNNYPHYALPALMPLSIASATLFRSRGAAVGLVAGSVWYVVLFALPNWGTPTERRHRIDAMVTVLRPYASRGCIYVNDGPTALYLLTSSCLPTPYIFSEHLNNAGENNAVGAPAQMRKLLQTRPAAISVANRVLDHPRNRTTAEMVNGALKKHYHEIAQLPDVFPGRQQIIYARNDLK